GGTLIARPAVAQRAEEGRKVHGLSPWSQRQTSGHARSTWEGGVARYRADAAADESAKRKPKTVRNVAVRTRPRRLGASGTRGPITVKRRSWRKGSPGGSVSDPGLPGRSDPLRDPRSRGRRVPDGGRWCATGIQSKS